VRPGALSDNGGVNVFGRRRPGAGLLPALAVVAGLAGCTDDEPPSPAPSAAPVPRPPFELSCPDGKGLATIDSMLETGEQTPEATVADVVERYPELSVTSAARTWRVTDLALYDEEGTIVALGSAVRLADHTWVLETTEGCAGTKPWG